MVAPKFFKIILDPNADSLTIPPEFTKRHGQNLPNSVFLKVPFGTPMEVKLVRCDGKTVLQRGWREFKNSYSLGFGHFLVFEQNGISEFNVAIFDKSAVEINYPVHTDKQRGKRIAENDPIQISDDDTDPVKLQDSTPEECWDGVGRERAVAKKTSMAYKKAMDFVSVHENPFFVRLLQQSYVSGRFNLIVSMRFAKQNLHCEGASSIIMVTNGKEWPGRCILRENYASVTAGWKKFVQDNGLKLGDACVFEVANKSTSHVWNVVIFRKSACVGSKNQESTSEVPQQNHSEGKKPDCSVKLDHGLTFGECSYIGAERQFSKKVEVQRAVVNVAYEKAVAFVSAHINPDKNSFHICVMQPFYVSYGFLVPLPLSFVKQSRLGDGANSISLVTNGKKWCVRCIVKDRRANLSSGWKHFANDNGLKIRDVCVFEVAERTERVWNVVIYRS